MAKASSRSSHVKKSNASHTRSQASQKTSLVTHAQDTPKRNPAGWVRGFFSLFAKAGLWVTRSFTKTYAALKQNRRSSVHTSFQRTRKRDFTPRPRVEGYIAFPWYVARILWNRRGLYARLVALFFVVVVSALGALQMTNLQSMNDFFDTTNESTGLIDPLERAFAVATSALSGVLANDITDIQALTLFLVYFFAALVVVWLLRQQLAGTRVRLRDGLYNANAPLIALLVLIAIGALQMLPFGLVSLVYMTASNIGLLSGGIDTAMFSLAYVLAGVLTLYFITTTVFALFIATIPGTYPLKAYRSARRIVAGQRMRLVVRLVWLAFILVSAWFILLVPTIIVINSINAQGTVAIPFVIHLATSCSVVYGTAYMYLLYRRMIDDPVVEN